MKIYQFDNKAFTIIWTI